jgi:hypothetical protein
MRNTGNADVPHRENPEAGGKIGAISNHGIIIILDSKEMEKAARNDPSGPPP